MNRSDQARQEFMASLGEGGMRLVNAVREGLSVDVVDDVMAAGRLSAAELDRLALPRQDARASSNPGQALGGTIGSPRADPARGPRCRGNLRQRREGAPLAAEADHGARRQRAARSARHRCGSATGRDVAWPDRSWHRRLIQAWRVARKMFADLSGEGARRHGGRWNSPGLPMVYMAEHPALAVLEIRVHLDLPPDLLPDDYSLMQVDLPDEPPEVVTPIPTHARAIGDAWIRSSRTALLRVPSVIVPNTTSLLLNPRHSRASDARITRTSPLEFDPRLWECDP